MGSTWARLPVASLVTALFFMGCGGETTEDVAPSPQSQACPGGKRDGGGREGDFDFIVVGSGAGGGPLAANLARAGYEVLLLEAGDDFGGKPAYQIPAWQGVATEDPVLSWSYFVEHYADPEQADRDTKRVPGKGVLYP